MKSDMVHFTDWPVTFAALGGGAFPTDREIDGRDVSPVLRGDPVEEKPRFWQWNRYSPVGTCNAGMRDGKWKLVRPIIPEAMGLTQEDLDMDKKLKYEPDSITDITRDPEPERTIPDPPAPLLFDLDADPGERNDLAASRPEIVSRMQSSIDAWFGEVVA